MPSSGKFITFEGGEGTGKSTQVCLLAEALVKRGKEVLKTREPGGSQGAEKIRDLLVKGDPDQWDPLTEALLFLAARRDHVKRLIEPALEQNKWVLCDRFQASTLVYSGFGHGIAPQLLDQLYLLSVGSLQPDLIFILSLDPREGLARALARPNQDNRIEKKGLAFHQRVHEGYLALARKDPTRYKLIEASRSPQEVHHEILSHINS